MDLLLSKYLIVIPIKSGDPVRDAKAHQGSPLSDKTPNGSNKTIFEAVRLGSTKLMEGGAVASVDVVCD